MFSGVVQQLCPVGHDGCPHCGVDVPSVASRWLQQPQGPHPFMATSTSTLRVGASLHVFPPHHEGSYTRHLPAMSFTSHQPGLGRVAISSQKSS